MPTTTGNLIKYEVYVLRIQDGGDEEATVDEFSVSPMVANAYLNFRLKHRVHLTRPNDTRFLRQYSLDNRGNNMLGFVGPGVIDADIDAPQAWEHSTGDLGVIVAVIDTGIDVGHPDLFGEDANGNGRLDAGEDVGLDGVAATGDAGELNGSLDSNIWVNPAETAAGAVAGVDDAPADGAVDDFAGANFTTNAVGVVSGNGAVQDLDGSSHGTHVAGIIGALGNNDRGIAGVNWRISLLPVRTDGAMSSTLAAMRYVLALQGAGFNIRVINLSSGLSPNDFPLGTSMFRIHNALMRWRNQLYSLVLGLIDGLPAPGILLVNAAGYDGLNIDTTAPEDRNGNGALNAGEDVNANGALDPAGADNLGNGLLDAGEDANANGRLDPGEDAADGVPDVFLDLPVVLTNASILTVTRSDHRDNFVPRTNYGTASVDVAAPGQQILSTIRQANGSYGRLSGTSMATPHVSGMAAHMLSMPAFSGHTTAQVKARIMTGLNAPAAVPHPHGVDPRVGLLSRVVSGLNNDGRARMTMGDDFGDAPDPPYPTRLANWVARHEDIGEEWLARSLDFYPLPGDVSPEFDAFNNAAWPPDPDGRQNLTNQDAYDDGVVLTGPFIFGGPLATVEIYIDTENNQLVDHDGGRYGGGGHGPLDGVHGPGDDKYVWVNGFFDWNRDGDWNDPDEHVFSLRADPSTWPGSGGHYTLTFPMPPPSFPLGPYSQHWARVRLDYGENLGQPLAAPGNPVGPSAGGLVDYWPVLPNVKGNYFPNRYESIFLGGNPDLDLKRGLAQFGEVEDYPFKTSEYDCGPGPHWIDTCSSGNDIFEFTEATLGIDTNGDCQADTSVALSGPTTIGRSGPQDDSINFPGVRFIDGHQDVIDTEIQSMNLTGAGITVVAGAGSGQGGVLPQSRGAIAENADTQTAESFFFVYFEVDWQGSLLYNHEPHRVYSQIEKVPPKTTYFGDPVCLGLYDSPIPGQGMLVANLTTSCHAVGTSCEGETVPPPPVEPDGNLQCTSGNGVCTGNMVPLACCTGLNTGTCPGLPLPCCLGPNEGTCNKTRFVTFNIPNNDSCTGNAAPFPCCTGVDAGTCDSTGETAIRVVFNSMHIVVPPYSGGPTVSFNAFANQYVYVGAPAIYTENGAPGGISFNASFTQCAPHFQNWNTVGLLHVTGPQIVPSSNYGIEHMAADCLSSPGAGECAPGGDSVSIAAEIRTTRWGDVATPYNPPSASVQPDVSDVSALVDKFRNVPTAPGKARALLVGVPGNPWGRMDSALLSVPFGFGHISACVDAFRGTPYPFRPGKCAGAPSGGASGACASSSECVGNNGAPPCNLYCP